MLALFPTLMITARPRHSGQVEGARLERVSDTTENKITGFPESCFYMSEFVRVNLDIHFTSLSSA